jgi:hypothetical protein
MIRHALIAVFIAASGAVVAPVEARQMYATYDGPDAVKVGAGGTRLEKNGIEFWTSGAPSRPFRVLGIFTDTRKDRWWDGDALGSGSIARKAREAGASAVIVLSADTRLAGVSSFSSYSGNSSGSFSANSFGGFLNGSSSGSSSGFGFGGSELVNKVVTRLLVVRYLTDDEVAVLGKPSPSGMPGAASLMPSPIADPVASRGVAPMSQADGDEGGPPKRKAKTRSGFCYEVPKGYAGTGSITRPAITSATPACYQLLER